MAKKVIRLFCSLGRATDLLVMKMQEAALEQGKDYGIEVYALSDFEDVCRGADVCLFGPQASYALEQLKKQFSDIPMRDIPIQMYALMDGRGVLALAEEMLEEKDT